VLVRANVVSKAVLRLERYKIDIEEDQISRQSRDYKLRPVLVPPNQTHRNISSNVAPGAQNTQVTPETTALETFVNETLTAGIRRWDSQHRQMRILAATIQVCSEMGLRTANMAEIAKRARVSTASLYQDFHTREKLLEESAAFAALLVANELASAVAETGPRERLTAIFIRHCRVINHPHTRWLCSAYVSGEFPQTLGAHPCGKKACLNIADSWRVELKMLHDRGIVEIPKMDMAINFILGAIYGRTILGNSFFGGHNSGDVDLKTAATITVDWLFDQFGALT
jgi:AcrR family transcriptional regulator